MSAHLSNRPSKPPTREEEEEIEASQQALLAKADEVIFAAGKVQSARERYRKRKSQEVEAVPRPRTASGGHSIAKP